MSEDRGIQRFEPRMSAIAGEPVVWAVDAQRLRNYLLPRDCPRVTFYRGPRTTAQDAEQFLGSSTAVVAIEGGWLDRVRACRLYVYHLPEEGFDCIDECAGYFVSRRAATPTRVEVIDDVLAALVGLGAEVRLLPELWALHDRVAKSTLAFSMIRMRNALRR